MENKEDNQLELFSGAEGIPIKPQDSGKRFFNYVRSYEKTIIVIIGFVLTGIISFSLGVEKGKRLSMLKPNNHFDLAITQSHVRAVAPVVQQKNPQPLPQQPAVLQKQGYVIQLGSFKTRSNAQREAESLKKKGFQPIFINKGDYILLCVGNFTKKEAAEPQLTELRKLYQDCFLRRL